MSLTFNDKPQKLMCAYSPVPLVVTSTKNTEENFKYIFDIITDGWQFDDDIFRAGSLVGYTSSTQQHSFEVGDTIYVDRTGASGDTLNTGYNAYHTVVEVIDDYAIGTDAQYGITTPAISGTTYKDVRLKLSPDPNGRGVLDSHRILETLVSYDLNQNNTGFTETDNTFKLYNIKVGEEYVFYWPFKDNFFSSGYVGFTGDTGHPFVVGDKIFVKQDGNFTNESYEGNTQVQVASEDKSIVTFKPFGSSTPAEPGTIRYTDSRTTQFQGLTSLTDSYIFNGIRDFEEWNDWDYTEYAIGKSTSKFLTTAPNNLRLKSTDKMWHNIYVSGDSTNQLAFQLEVTVNDNTGGTSSYYIKNDFYNTTTDNFYQIGVGPWNLNHTDSSNITGDTLPIIRDNTDTYSVKVNKKILIGPSVIAASETKTYEIDDRCSNQENVRLIFMDKLGSFVGFNFDRVSRDQVSVDRINYQKTYGDYDASTGSYGWDTTDRGSTTISADIVEGMSIESNWVNDTESDFIKGLFTSPLIWHQKEDGTMLPIVLTNTDFEIKKRKADRLFNYTLQFVYGYQVERQRN